MTTDDSILFRSGDPNFMTSLARGLEVLQAFSGQTRTLKMALNPASSDYTKKSHDLIENLVPGFALKPKFSCR